MREGSADGGIEYGQAGCSGMPFLSVASVSEAPVPEPGALALFGLAGLGLGPSQAIDRQQPEVQDRARR